LAALLLAALLAALAVRILLVLLAGFRLTALLLLTGLRLTAALLAALILIRIVHWETLLDRGPIPQSRQPDRRSICSGSSRFPPLWRRRF
jgi:hypothetical protein